MLDIPTRLQRDRFLENVPRSLEMTAYVDSSWYAACGESRCLREGHSLFAFWWHMYQRNNRYPVTHDNVHTV